jgi:antitoxin component YwqK of YwqJK toxin-antitoxin module
MRSLFRGETCGSGEYITPTIHSFIIITNCNHIIHMELTTYYSNGSIRSIGNTVKGERHGLWNYYYPNGYYKRLETYKMGKLDGEVREYDMEFRVIRRTLYQNGNPIP